MIEMRAEPASSPIETKGFPRPAVVTPEKPRANTVPPCMAAAVPPPAMIAVAHVNIGDIPVTTEAVAMVPATMAVGVAMRSIK